jgi:hypothetical protein
MKCLLAMMIPKKYQYPSGKRKLFAKNFYPCKIMSLMRRTKSWHDKKLMQK